MNDFSTHEPGSSPEPEDRTPNDGMLIFVVLLIFGAYALAGVGLQNYFEMLSRALGGN